MVKVTMPMGGFSASGSIGGALTFATTKGRQYARQLVVPSNPNSAGQLSTRAMMRFLAQAWSLLTVGDQATWEPLSTADNISPFNAYVRFNMNRWTQFSDPLQTPTKAAGTAPVMGALTVTGGVRQLTVSQAITTASDIWGMLICMSQSTGFTPGKTNVRYVARYAASPITAVITPLIPGTWFVRTAGSTTGGLRTAFVTEVSGVVT